MTWRWKKITLIWCWWLWRLLLVNEGFLIRSILGWGLGLFPTGGFLIELSKCLTLDLVLAWPLVYALGPLVHAPP
jgi:hypothetical protein